MSNYDKEIIDKEQKIKEKLEAEKLQYEVIVYQVEIGMYKVITEDKKTAFEIWRLLADKCFNLEQLRNEYEAPNFRYRKPITVKLVAEKLDIWKDYESAQRAHAAYTAIKESTHKVGRKKEKDLPF